MISPKGFLHQFYFTCQGYGLPRLLMTIIWTTITIMMSLIGETIIGNNSSQTDNVQNAQGNSEVASASLPCMLITYRVKSFS